MINTLPPGPRRPYPGKHFFKCSETTSPLVDSLSGLTIATQTGVTIGAGDDSGVNVRFLCYNAGASSSTTPNLSTGAWKTPSGRDIILIVCAKHRMDPGGETSEGGFTSFGIGRTDVAQLRVQPYQAVFSADTDKFATPMYLPQAVRVEGETDIYAAVMRGTALEHYCNGILTGSRDYGAQASALRSAFDSFAPSNVFHAGHSAFCSDILKVWPDHYTDEIPGAGRIFWGEGETPYDVSSYYERSDGSREIPGSFLPVDGNTTSTGEYADDYYGFFIGYYDSAPSQAAISTALLHCLTDWPAGTKLVPDALL